MSRYSCAFAVSIAAFAFVSVVDDAAAQRRSSRNTTLSQLQRETIKEELNLTDEQEEALSKVSKGATPSSAEYREFLSSMKKLKGDERDAKRKEFTAASAKRREEAGDKAMAVLTAGQRKQFTGILVRDMGAEALRQDAIEKELKLTDAQKEKIKESLEERRKAFREQGIRASKEDREKLSKEWDTKILANLDDSQRGRWTAMASVTTAGSSPSTSVASTPTGSAAPRAVAQPSANASISFGAPSKSTDGKQEKITEFSFTAVEAPWRMVLQGYAKAAGLTLDLHDVPPGTFNHIDEDKYTPKRALDIMNGYLLREGYITVQKDKFLIVWRFDNGLPPSMVPEIKPEQLSEEYAEVDNQLVTVAYRIANGDVRQLAEEVDILLDPYPFVAVQVLEGSRVLVVTDLTVNQRRVRELVEAATGKVMFRQFPIKNMDAEEANDLVRAQLGLPPSTTNVSDATRRRGFTSQSSQQAAEGVNVTPESRTNSLLVSGTAQQLKLVEDILKAVDVEGPDGPYSRGSRTPYLEVYTMTASNVMEVAKTVESLMPGKIINEDGSARKLHIKATQAEHEEIRALIAKLDRGGGGSGAVAVINLRDLDPVSTAQMLVNMYAKDAGPSFSVVPDAFNRRLICKGSVDEIAQIKNLLLGLGEDGTPPPKKTEVVEGPIQIPLGGRDPEMVLEAFRVLWERQQANPVIIKIPGKTNPVRDAVLPGRRLDETFRPRDNAAEKPSFKRDTTDSEKQRRDYAFTALFQDGDKEKDLVDELNTRLDSEPGNSPPGPDAQASVIAGDPEKPDLVLTVIGDTLVVDSTDAAALTRVEELMAELNQSLPNQSRWTVFYLTAADCTEAAAMLEQLFPTSSIGTSSTGGGDSLLGGVGAGLSNFGSSLMDMTGLNAIGTGPQTLRIIPDSRANSLWVTGPTYLVDQVDSMLQTIDVSELPQSQRDLLPRPAIQLKYADAKVVGEKVRELFKIYTEAQRAQGQGNNPLAMMMGGGGGQNRGTPVRLTITVDETTNRIIVGCANSLYEEIKVVCEDMDEAIRKARPGLKVFTLSDANASAVVRTLQSMLPRVSVNTPGSNNNRSNNNSNSSSEAAARDAQRQALQRAAAAGAFGGGGVPSFRTRGGGGTGGRNTGTRGGGFGGGGGRRGGGR